MSGGRHSGPLAGGTIRRRLARILALPALVVLLLLALVAAGQVSAYRTSQTTSRSVDLALAVQNLVSELQTERGVTAAVLGGNPSFRPELSPARQRVDRQRLNLQSLLAGGGDLNTRMRSALAQLDGLSAIRAATDAASAGRAATFAYYTDRIAGLTDVDLGLDRAGDGELRRSVTAFAALQELTEATAQERAFLNGVFSAGGFAKGEFVQFATMRATRQAATDRFQRSATTGQQAGLDFSLNTGAARETLFFEQVAIDSADGRHLVVNPQAWWSGLTTVLDDLGQLQQHIGSQIQIRSHDLQTAAAQRIGALLLGVLLCLLGSVYLAVLASRSITRPLAALASEADSVAVERLPAAVMRVQAGRADDPPDPPRPVEVPPRATEEIQSVATALGRLQSAAYDLAIEQAVQRRRTIESLANLGRRNQNLIRRQLGFITSLEREEIDPQALSNLFELDHLATRMRRNADSLLVLVGSASPRQLSTPVPVSDVIRAAVSEVEEYRRVSLRRVDEALVAGPAVGAVAHVLSELIENGLSFSPPDCEVEIQGRQQAGGYLIAITDQGVGMTSEELRLANSRLRGEGDFIAAPTRFLGHFVVGELARQISAQVELLPSPVVGVTARVTLPPALLTLPRSIVGAPAELTVAPAPDEATTAESTRPEGIPVVVHVDVAVAPEAADAPDTAVDADLEPAGRPAPEPAQRPAAQPVPTPVPPPLPTSLTEASLFEPSPSTAAKPSAAQRVPPAATIRLRPGIDAPEPAPQARPEPYLVPFPPTTAAGTAITTASAARTRNGLPKRAPRAERAGSPAAANASIRQVIDLDAAHRASVDSSPATVGARLTALRAGVRRGQEAQDVEEHE
ncbi:MAG: nitrate- and nitrite sensing domain-containing protein [Kineosporiaceae bacterium]